MSGALPSDRAVAADAAEPEVSTLRASIPSAVKRNWRGQFVKSLRWTPPESREWLIWSRYHNAWHRRDTHTGGACGYTSDISHAGLFPRAKADTYNDGDRNEAFHVSEKRDQLRRAYLMHEEALALLAQAMSASGQDPQGLEAKPASAVPEGNAP